MGDAGAEGDLPPAGERDDSLDQDTSSTGLERSKGSTMPEEMLERVHKLEVASATQAATTAGAQATQAATQAGATATGAASVAGLAAAIASGAGGFIVGIFLGLAIARAGRSG